MTGSIKSGEVAFQPRARLLKLLGGELIRDDVMAMVEVIKNAHDADAKKVDIVFEDVTTGGGSVIVSDNGNGMTLDDLLSHWMQPAGSSKKRGDRRSPAGRRYLGEKGVGRFAVDRLGRHCELISLAKGTDTEVVASFDWDAFDNDERFLDDIKTGWSTRRPEVLKRHGTVLRIYGLRRSWNARSFRRLTNRLSRIISPFAPDTQSFEISITSDDFPDYSGELGNPFFETSPYRAVGEFDGLNTLKLTVNETEKEYFWSGPGNLTCGPVRFVLNGYDLEKDALLRVGALQDVRAWLQEWSGFSVYRDGFRVLPYGEPDDDWLRLDQRRVNNPVNRFSNNQIVGIAQITADENPGLKDQTNRLGLDHNGAFNDFRRLTLWVIEILEGCRQELRNAESTPGEGQIGGSPSPSVDAIIDLLDADAGNILKKSGIAIAPTLDRLRRAYKSENSELVGYLEKQSELAAFGHNTGFLAASISPIFEQIEGELASMAAPPLSSIDTLFSKAQEQLRIFDFSKSLVKDSSRDLDLTAFIKRFQEIAVTISNSLSDAPTRVLINHPADGLMLVEGRNEILLQILMVLLQNSLHAMSRSTRREIRIRIKLSRDRKKAVLSFKDTGAGISDEVKSQMFEAGFTTRRSARGMGLSIAKSLAIEMGADLSFSDSKLDHRRGYTGFKLIFPMATIMRR